MKMINLHCIVQSNLTDIFIEILFIRNPIRYRSLDEFRTHARDNSTTIFNCLKTNEDLLVIIANFVFSIVSRMHF